MIVEFTLKMITKFIVELIIIEAEVGADICQNNSYMFESDPPDMGGNLLHIIRLHYQMSAVFFICHTLGDVGHRTIRNVFL